jgi:hypothetical protein
MGGYEQGAIVTASSSMHARPGFSRLVYGSMHYSAVAELITKV